MAAVLNDFTANGVVYKTTDKSFMIKQFLPVRDRDGDIGTVENRFEILTPYGRKYPLRIGERIHVVGQIRFMTGDRSVQIMPHVLKKEG